MASNLTSMMYWKHQDVYNSVSLVNPIRLVRPVRRSHLNNGVRCLCRTFRGKDDDGACLDRFNLNSVVITR